MKHGTLKIASSNVLGGVIENSLKSYFLSQPYMFTAIFLKTIPQ